MKVQVIFVPTVDEQLLLPRGWLSVCLYELLDGGRTALCYCAEQLYILWINNLQDKIKKPLTERQRAFS